MPIKDLSKCKKIALALRKYRKNMEDWVKPIDGIRHFRASSANAFILGVTFDRSIPAWRAWESAEWINDSLGDSDDGTALWKNIAKIEAKRLIGFLRYGYGGYAFHRHYKTFARQLPMMARIILDKYGGDPRTIWNNQRDIEEVRNRLEELPGIGPALSRMAVLMLATAYGLLGGKEALPQLDIKPDVQLMRVFRRSGLIPFKGTENEAIKTAQILNPKFPAELDAPSWEIGQKWCRPTSPHCSACPISGECPKIFGK
jgi:endonuclease III